MKEMTYPACSGCGSTTFTTDPAGRRICAYCHTVYAPPGRACPVCGAAYESSTRYCPSCGADLSRECPACGALNPLSARNCLICGQQLEMLDSLFARVTGEAHWQRGLREEAAALKAQEETASQARLAEMWAAEMRRREALAEAQAEHDRQERIIIAIAVVVALLITIVTVVLTATAPGTTP